MNKYMKAISGYEKARQEILRITKDIGHALESSECACKYSGGLFGDKQDCLLAYYKYRKNAALIDECKSSHYHEAGEDECGDDLFEFESEPVLCNSGLKVDNLVQERKRAKKQFGIEKRRISALGRAMLSAGDAELNQAFNF